MEIFFQEIHMFIKSRFTHKEYTNEMGTFLIDFQAIEKFILRIW